MSQENAMHEEIEDLREAVEAAKLREAEQASALEIARTLLRACVTRGDVLHKQDAIDAAIKFLSRPNPAAALAERDRGIEKRTAERCAEIAHSMYPAGWCREKILREFNLEPKPEEKPANG